MINSVRNAIKILNCFSQDSLELSLAGIAKQLNMNKSTLHHLIRTLREEGVLVKNENNLYELGTKMFEWGNLVGVRNRLGTLAIAYLHEIVKQTGLIAHFGVLEGDGVLILVKSENPDSFNIDTKIGGRVLSYCTAIGKALLTEEAEQHLEFMSENGLRPRTKHTITDIRKLRSELEMIDDTGLAYDRGEYTEGIHCIASKVTGGSGECIAAISISGPQNRMQMYRKEYEQVIRTASLAVSKELRNFHLKDLKRRREGCS